MPPTCNFPMSNLSRLSLCSRTIRPLSPSLSSLLPSPLSAQLILLVPRSTVPGAVLDRFGHCPCPFVGAKQIGTPHAVNAHRVVGVHLCYTGTRAAGKTPNGC